MDDDGLASGALDVNLLGSSDVQVAQVGLQLLVGSLEVEQSLQKIKYRIVT